MAVWACLLIFWYLFKQLNIEFASKFGRNSPFTRPRLLSNTFPDPSLAYLESIIGPDPAKIFLNHVLSLKKLWRQKDPIALSSPYFQDRVFALCQWQRLLYETRAEEENMKMSHSVVSLLVTVLQDIQRVQGFHRRFLYQRYVSNPTKCPY